MSVKEILKLAGEFSNQVASRFGCRIVASALYGSRVSGYAKPSSDVDLLLILENYDKGVLYIYEEYGGYPFSALTVDKGLFELDLEKGELGEFVAGRLLTPFIPIEGIDYIEECSVRFKMRVVVEILANLESEYPDVYRELRIKPEFFLYEKLWRRGRIYPHVKYSYARILSKELISRNLPAMMEGFMRGLRKLEAEGVVRFENGYIVPVKSLCKGKAKKILSAFKEMEKATRAYIAHGYAGRGVSPVKIAWEFASKILREASSQSHGGLEHPERYLYLPSAVGYSSVFEKFSPERLADTLEPFKGFRIESIEKLGGALNFVDLVTLSRDGETRRVVVKKFKDWYGFKWFPLSIWTLGVQRFYFKGRTRMLKEYSGFMRLSKLGVPSPKIIHISLADKLLLTEYVTGQTFERVLRRFFSGDSEAPIETCRLVGRSMAEIHSFGMILGDPKPENIKISGLKTYFLDLEQSSMGGDESWDLAELLYFPGCMTLNSMKAKIYATSVLEGYLEAGKAETVERVASIKYLRVFSTIVSPNVLLAMKRVCRDVSTPRRL